MQPVVLQIPLTLRSSFYEPLVIPAKAGTQYRCQQLFERLRRLDSRLRGNDDIKLTRNDG
jgi:hypothetical protein